MRNIIGLIDLLIDLLWEPDMKMRSVIQPGVVEQFAMKIKVQLVFPFHFKISILLSISSLYVLIYLNLLPLIKKTFRTI